MEKYELLTELLGLPNLRVTHYQQEGPDRLILVVESTVEAGVCPSCQEVSQRVHEVSEGQRIRDLSMWNRRCWLKYAPRRFKCARCENTFVERVVWRAPGLDYTVRYEEAIYARARREPLLQIAQTEGLSEEQVTGIFERGAKKHSRNGGIPR